MTRDPLIIRKILGNRLFIAGVVVAVFFWMLDAAVDILRFKGVGFVRTYSYPIEISLHVVFIGLIIGLSLYVHHYIISLKRAEEAQREATVRAESERAKSEAILAGIGDGIVIQDTDFRVLYQNQIHKDMLGEHVGSPSNETYESDSGEGCCPVAMCFNDAMVHRSERSVVTDEGTRYFEITASPIPNAAGKITRGVEVVREITDRKRLEEELKRLAVTDNLTQTYNRTKLNEIIRMEMERAKRFGRPLSIMMFDIDRFKEINDRYGHIVGDDVLKTTTALVKEHIRKIDYLVRFGGDEFVIIIPETGLGSAEALAERIRKRMEKHGFDKVGRVTASLGITGIEKGDDDIDGLIKRADDALYKAKSSGRNRVEVSG